MTATTVTPTVSRVHSSEFGLVCVRALRGAVHLALCTLPSASLPARLPVSWTLPCRAHGKVQETQRMRCGLHCSCLVPCVPAPNPTSLQRAFKVLPPPVFYSSCPQFAPVSLFPGCSSKCKVEEGWECTKTSPSTCWHKGEGSRWRMLVPPPPLLLVPALGGAAAAAAAAAGCCQWCC